VSEQRPVVNPTPVTYQLIGHPDEAHTTPSIRKFGGVQVKEAPLQGYSGSTLHTIFAYYNHS
jgi:hypothetical protein